MFWKMIRINKEEYECQIRLLYAEIAMQIFFSQKVSRISTRKKGLITNHRDALIAEQLENKTKEAAMPAVAEAATRTYREKCSQLFVLNVENQRWFLLDQTEKSQFIAKIATSQEADINLS